MDMSKNIVDIVEDTLDQYNREMVPGEWLWEQSRTMPPQYFFEQFRRIKISLPRRSGHSTAAANLLYRNPNSMMIVPNWEMKHHIIGGSVMKSIFVANHFEDMDMAHLFLKERVHFATPDSIRRLLHESNRLIPLIFPLELIIFDPVSLFNEKDLDEIRVLLYNKTKLFVELQ